MDGEGWYVTANVLLQAADRMRVLLMQWEDGAVQKVVVAKTEPAEQVCVLAGKHIGFNN